MGAAAMHAHVADQEGATTGQRATVVSRPIEWQRRQTTVRGQTDVAREALSLH